ncbi:branched-chain amino acid transport system substrate-binding protein [Natronocella acetinitrilica]|uniref:Branched-chain amino acid transport system substrate-binding protein n=1 Tax=Natronocella acetinitrilica TaxID=414046 RepID=A0AAE3G7L9_9GAMM|nr:ABC transporter substrate-binding protein [Natronocella acetinitrilica]MCP1675297.1 branched-chain amino acid transport system substrate-binding protein [Natronocella acetinitrilica]
MKLAIKALCALAAVAAMSGAQVAAQEPVKIGMITTLSTAGGYLGEDVRDGFQLAIEEGNGELGGIPVDLLVEDDGLSPEQARQIATRMVESEGIRLMTGTIFSNVAMALVPRLMRDGVMFVSPNAGPSQLAGRMCHENYFNVAWQNDNLHEAMGQYVSDQGYDNVYILAPNYPAGRDALEGFKRYYTGELAGETYTQLGQSDFAAEISSIRAAEPDAVFFFLPGGMGVNFTRQYNQAGLSDRFPLFGPAFSFDNTLVSAVGSAAEGVYNTSQWSADIDNAANRAFVAAYTERYGRQPTLYASQGYDAARLIGSALATVEGDISDMDAFREALRRADFDSVRGNFRFGTNHHPIQDIYVREVVRNEDGELTNRIVARVFGDHQDAFVDECPMR